MTKTHSFSNQIMFVVAKLIAILAAGYLVFLISSLIIQLLHSTLNSVLFVPPFIGGLAVGLLSMLVFATRYRMMIGLALSWIPTALSWLYGGTHVCPTEKINAEFVNGHLKIIGSTSYGQNYRYYALMLFFAIIGGIIGYLICLIRDARRGDAEN